LHCGKNILSSGGRARAYSSYAGEKFRFEEEQGDNGKRYTSTKKMALLKKKKTHEKKEGGLQPRTKKPKHKKNKQKPGT